MSTPGSVTVIPGKRFLDPLETIDLADLDALARPVVIVNPLSIGAGQLIAADVVTIIQRQGIGISAAFLFTTDRTVPNGAVLGMGSVTVAGTAIGNPIWCQQLASVPAITFAALVTATNLVTLSAVTNGSTPVVIPGGTVVNLRIFT